MVEAKPMTVDINALDYGLLAPEFIVLGTIFLCWAVDLVLPREYKRWIGWISIIGSIAAIAAAIWGQWGLRTTFAGVLRVDEFAVFFKVVFLIAAIGVTLISMDYADRFLPQPGEYYGLILTGTLGMIFMAAANELLTAYISLELLSFSSYVLVSYAKTNLKSNEAGLKYIILGAFSSALLLYGISLLYGSVGTTYFPDIATAISRMSSLPAGFNVALALILAGLGFKIAAVPFHMWTPDVYEGAPTPVTAYLSVASKAAGFALVVRLLVSGLLPIQDQYQTIFGLLAVLTMTLGNLVAIQQRNIKRLLAYSSIGQAGYVLVGVAAFTRNPDIAEQAARGVIFHLTGYVFTNLAAFGAVIAFQNLNNGKERISDMAGFARRAPFAALVMMSALFSLAGMPLFAGFVTKFYLFAAAARAGLLWLVAIAVINSTISLYYYLLVVYEMYVRTPPGYEVASNGHGHAAMAVTHAAPALALAAAPAAVSPGGGNVALASGGSSQHSAVIITNGHAADGRVTNGHAVAADAHGGGHDGQGAHDGGDGGPSIPWWRRDITADVPHERSYPAVRVGWAVTLGLFLFAVGIFYIGLYPRDLIDLLQSASSALFAS
jgi:NADH-quinone oxidoreductase subunit N